MSVEGNTRKRPSAGRAESADGETRAKRAKEGGAAVESAQPRVEPEMHVESAQPRVEPEMHMAMYLHCCVEREIRATVHPGDTIMARSVTMSALTAARAGVGGADVRDALLEWEDKNDSDKTGVIAIEFNDVVLSLFKQVSRDYPRLFGSIRRDGKMEGLVVLAR